MSRTRSILVKALPLGALLAPTSGPACAVAGPGHDRAGTAPGARQRRGAGPARCLNAVTVPSAPDAWGGPRTGKEATLSDRVVSYAINATLDPVKHTVTGRQKLTWRNRSKTDVRSVYVHTYMNAFEGGGSTFYTEGRNNQTGFRSETGPRAGEWGHIELRSVTQGGAKVSTAWVQPDNGPSTDHTVMRFDLPTPVAPGASTTFDIDFLTQLPRVVARTGYFGSFHLVAQWFPKIAVLELPGERGATAPRWNAHEFHQQSEFYADFGHFDVRLTVPKEYVVGATGEAQGAPVEKNGWTTHHFVQGDVHDFAWTADKRSAPPLRTAGPGRAARPWRSRYSTRPTWPPARPRP
ncbi:hypothetical protein LP420_08400 [Massilia sp. B-10]|nr:hypothetical protein LP420_08400 [Massilia sp. B-10]